MTNSAPSAFSSDFSSASSSDQLPVMEARPHDDGVTNGALVMLVDDEPINIRIVQKHLRAAGFFRFVTTTDSREAVDLIREHKPDVLLLDIMMPQVSGLDILKIVRNDPDLFHLPVLILTAATDEQTKLEALSLGATDLLNKPAGPAELLQRIRNALIVKAHHDHMEEYSSRLESEIKQRTKALEQLREELIMVLACAAEYRDQETGNHVVRVGRYAAIIARNLGFSESRVELIEQAAVLHDVGKIGVSDMILHKPGRLTAEEMAAMRKHCEYGMNILLGMPSSRRLNVEQGADCGASCHSPILETAAVISMSHHEWWDGSGYPQGLAGNDIPIEGRITAVADVFDALGSRRSYKPRLPVDECFAILEEGRGRQFDSQVLDAFFADRERIVEIRKTLEDCDS